MNNQDYVVFGEPTRGKSYWSKNVVFQTRRRDWRTGLKRFFVVTQYRFGAPKDGGTEWGDWHFNDAKFSFTPRIEAFLDRLANRIYRRWFV